LNYDSSNTLVEEITANNDSKTPLTHSYHLEKSNSISILKGKRDGAPEFLNASY
jgi:hypothetical protein